MRRIALLVPALLLASSAGAQSVAAPELVVNGAGVVSINPDNATLNVAVVTRASTAAEASRLNADRMQRLLSALRSAGVPDAALITAGFNVGQERDALGRMSPSDAPLVYAARNGLQVSLTDLSRIGTLIDLALGNGATDIGGITYASSREGEARRAALAIAIRSARQSAEAAATAADKVLGPVLEIAVDQPNIYAPLVERGTIESAPPIATAVMPGDISVRATARVRFALLPRER